MHERTVNQPCRAYSERLAGSTVRGDMAAASTAARISFGLLCLLVVAFLPAPQISAVEPRRGPARAFVSNERDGTISVIDTASDQLISTIRVGGRLRGIHLSPNEKILYVAMTYPSNQRESPTDKIVALDPATGATLAKYDGGRDPEQFCLNRTGTRLYTSNEDAGTLSVTDLTSGRVLASVVVGIEPEGVAMSPSGRWVYVTAESSSNVTVIDAVTNRVKATFPVGARPRNAAFSRDGRLAYVTAENGGTVSIVDTRRHAVIDTIVLPRGQVKPMGIAVAPRGNRIYVSNGRGNSVSVIDAVTHRIVATIPVAERPWGIDVTSDGSKVYTANGLSNTVSVISTSTNQVVKAIPVGEGPWGIAIAKR